MDEGLAAQRARDYRTAAAAFEKAVAADPTASDARYELSNTYRDLQRLADAEREIRAYIAARPQDPKGYTALGVTLVGSGRPEQAVAAYEAAMRADPTFAVAVTNWLHAQQYVPNVTAASLSAAHARWAELCAPPESTAPFANARTTDRALVVGFVSPDLSQHPVGLLSARLFANLDHALIRPVVFSTRPAEYEDDVSRSIAAVTQWTAVFGLPDEALAAFIRASKVDVLVDMSGHMAHNRLKLFAARAAPVQVTWLGYPSTTGVPAMDYLLATPTLAPAAMQEFVRERIVRLPETHACFAADDAPPVEPLPAIANGYVTFGCLNNPAKISDDALASFANILKRIPGSRLKLRYVSLSEPESQVRLRRALETRGIAPERVDISGNVPRAAYLSTYGEIDIALDTFPYSGCMTTCEALWMGCPVVTFTGDTIASRQSASVLTAAGLAELIAPDRHGYEDLAVRLTHDLTGLSALRAGLRGRVASSPLSDGPRFARVFTEALRKLWAEWCSAH
jgi:predicted O-linked N-acetylglucosamine transferase (SPINDLY family)